MVVVEVDNVLEVCLMLLVLASVDVFTYENRLLVL